MLSTRESTVELTQVVKRYADIRAVDNIDLTIMQGEILGSLGLTVLVVYHFEDDIGFSKA